MLYFLLLTLTFWPTCYGKGIFGGGLQGPKARADYAKWQADYAYRKRTWKGQRDTTYEKFCEKTPNPIPIRHLIYDDKIDISTYQYYEDGCSWNAPICKETPWGVILRARSGSYCTEPQLNETIKDPAKFLMYYGDKKAKKDENRNALCEVFKTMPYFKCKCRGVDNLIDCVFRNLK